MKYFIILCVFISFRVKSEDFQYKEPVCSKGCTKKIGSYVLKFVETLIKEDKLETTKDIAFTVLDSKGKIVKSQKFNTG